MEKVGGKAMHFRVGGLPFLSFLSGTVEQWMIFIVSWAISLLVREC